jgi:hypothetical protein
MFVATELNLTGVAVELVVIFNNLVLSVTRSFV